MHSEKHSAGHSSILRHTSGHVSSFRIVERRLTAAMSKSNNWPRSVFAFDVRPVQEL
jgi:hypothetical protein